ncbi:MAG: hypothetical protein LIP77_07370, partial [Planctomycetes bacterium]|nr:hypothetical protein [Planctomycetota bacterium]
VEVRALPFMLTYLANAIVARDGEGTIYTAAASSLAPAPLVFRRYPAGDSDAIRRVLASPSGKMFVWYSQGLFGAEEWPERDGGYRVRLTDRRFFSTADPDQARFVMDFTVAPDGTVQSLGPRRPDLGALNPAAELRTLWELTLTGRASDPDAPAVVPPGGAGPAAE